MSTGSCLCGSVRFEVRGSFGPVRYCHCTLCQRSTGSAFSANSRVRAADFELLAGDSLISEYESSPGAYRIFCSRCGSPVFARVESDPAFVRVRLGSLHEDPGVRPSAHVWVGDRAAWFEIADELPCFSTRPPAA